MDSLMTSAVELILSKKPSPTIQPAASAPQAGVPGMDADIEKRVRVRLGELRTADLAELRAQGEALQVELEAERRTADEGNFDLRSELAKKSDRSELAAKRAAAEIALEAADILQERLDELDAEIRKINAQCGQRDTKVSTIIHQIRKSHLTYLQAHCGNGERSFYKMNPDRPVAAMRLLISGEKQIREILKDDSLCDELMASITRFAIPEDFQSLLATFISPKDMEQHFNNQLPNYETEQ